MPSLRVRTAYGAPWITHEFATLEDLYEYENEHGLVADIDLRNDANKLGFIGRYKNNAVCTTLSMDDIEAELPNFVEFWIVNDQNDLVGLRLSSVDDMRTSPKTMPFRRPDNGCYTVSYLERALGPEDGPEDWLNARNGLSLANGGQPEFRLPS